MRGGGGKEGEERRGGRDVCDMAFKKGWGYGCFSCCGIFVEPEREREREREREKEREREILRREVETAGGGIKSLWSWREERERETRRSGFGYN